MMDKFVEGSLLWEGPHCGAREQCEESSLEESEGAETSFEGLTTTPISCFLVLLKAGGRENQPIQIIEPIKKGGMGQGCLSSGFVSHFPTLMLLGNKLISPS